MGRETERALDAYLVASVRVGDRRCFEILARRWNRKLISHAWRLLGNEDLARDAVQEAWAEIVRNLSKLRDENAFPAWAYRIVSCRCAKQIARLRGDRRLSAEFGPAAAPESPEPVPASDLEALRQAMKLLPPEQHAAVALFYLEELSVAEVAVSLNVPAGTVKTRLMHARRKLRRALEGDE